MQKVFLWALRAATVYLHTGPCKSAAGCPSKGDEPKAEVVAVGCFCQRPPLVRQDLVRPKELVKGYHGAVAVHAAREDGVEDCDGRHV
eukprot:scaffold106511_cov90-Phaeocystis_antarctica.AAC.1